MYLIYGTYFNIYQDGFGDFTALDVLIGGVGGPPVLLLDFGTAPLLLVSAFL